MSRSLKGVLPAKRLSLTDTLDRMTTMNDEEIFTMVEDLDKTVEELKAYRPYAPKTQKEQDYHLGLYREFVRIVSKLPAGSTEAEIDAVCFPENHDKLPKQLSMFLVWIFQRAKPRSAASGNYIQYRSLVKYRGSLLYWIKRIYDERDVPPPHGPKLFNSMSRSMQAIQAKLNKDGPKKSIKTFLGLGELRQLIDFEMFSNNSIENSEQHQAAWCIGRMVAVRPGSIAPSAAGRQQPLKWKDIKFRRYDNDPAKFQAQITFPTINIKAPENLDQNVVGVAREDARSLQVFVNSPEQAEELIFSVPHRLLLMAIRRNLLVGIKTIEELLTGEQAFIQIKQRHLDDPLFYRSKPHGAGIDTTSPMTATGLSVYLRERGAHLGYQFPVTWYSIRRRAATDLARIEGADTARWLLGHAPGTTTLERFYLALAPAVDVTSLGLGHTGDTGQSAVQMAAAWTAPLATSKLTSAQMDQIKNGIGILTRRLIAQDPDWRDDFSKAELKNYMKRVRKFAFRKLTSELHVLQTATITSGEMSARLKATSASNFAQAVIARCEADMDEIASEEVSDEALFEDDPAYQLDDEEAATGTNDEPEPDIESEIDRPDLGEKPLVLSPDTNDDITTSSVPYAQQVAVFMQLLLDNTLNTKKTFKETDRRCYECQVDETMPQAAKEKQWLNATKLNSHMESAVHSLYKQWQRRAEVAAEEYSNLLTVGDGDDTYQCKYCPLDPPRLFPSIEELEEHIMTSNEETNSLEHEEKKEIDGWMEFDFRGMASSYNQRETMKRRKRRLEDAGFVVEPALPGPVPHKKRAGIQHGWWYNEVPPRFEGFVVQTEHAVVPTIPEHLREFITVTDKATMWEYDELPEDFQEMIRETSASQTIKEFEDEEMEDE
ncbi:hypothetical protein M438DRAFT_339891 [Aureobasidium pullulans EXF-150]|uniref:Uncharacterized protein n=1 Tax=Aureobasidium pullulans EXF-150 TaxID=1043002 RepID=A0A074XX94_AURPU|nr:uncharacterized protein M438DRAFT_339891 [Aureobasidium pullulans EXF-150]KEQ79301.1 hypothetical protein M438DRAFT_339891 [Aureobasidium pullulans EXF-150]